MKGIFDLDNPIMSFLSKIADLMILNLLVLVCSIPIVTVGASLTSMYYVLLRIRNEECSSVAKSFFHAFKMNFKQATILWLIYLLVALVLAVEYYFIFVVNLEMLVNLRYLVYLVTVLVLISFTWSFVLLSRYDDGLGRTLYNAYCIGFTEFGRTVVMTVLKLLPLLLPLIWPVSMAVVIMIGFSLSGYLETFLFKKVFQKLETPRTEQAAPVENGASS